MIRKQQIMAYYGYAFANPAEHVHCFGMIKRHLPIDSIRPQGLQRRIAESCWQRCRGCQFCAFQEVSSSCVPGASAGLFSFLVWTDWKPQVIPTGHFFVRVKRSNCDGHGVRRAEPGDEWSLGLDQWMGYAMLMSKKLGTLANHLLKLNCLSQKSEMG